MIAPVERKTILFFDVPSVTDGLVPYVQGLYNYEVVVVQKEAAFFYALQMFDVDLVVLAMEMTDRNNHLDFEFGLKMQKSLHERGINKPILFLTTQYDKEPLTHFDKTQRMVMAVLPKSIANFSHHLGYYCQHLIYGRNPIPATGETEIRDERYYTNETVLAVVTHDDMLRDAIIQAFEPRQYAINIFESRDDLTGFIERFNNFCCVCLLDMEMPGLLGYDLLQKYLGCNNRVRFIPLASDYAGELKTILAEIGFVLDSKFTKPLHLPTLIEAVKQSAIKGRGIKTEKLNDIL
ncbi:MAG: hypothetical protein H6757_03140 [Candidatus Omnitrophica bacterium]|nr:hypothetical protein [Candidatus Omnitrophota bacterium]